MMAKSLSENGCVQFIFTGSLSTIIEKVFIIIITPLLGVVRAWLHWWPGPGGARGQAGVTRHTSQGWSKTTILLSSPLFRL